MHDLRAIRETPDAYRAGWRLRGVDSDPADEILQLDERLRTAQTALQAAQGRRNEASKLIGQAKARKDEAEASRLMAEVESDKEAIAGRTEEAKAVEAELREVLARLPNLAAAGVPEGPDESGNVELRVWGEPRRDGPAKDHVDLGETLGMMDFEAAARMSGARFVVLKGQLARLERALAQFMLDLQTTEHGYTEVSPPVLVRDDALFGTGQLPKFADDLFRTERVDREAAFLGVLDGISQSFGWRDEVLKGQRELEGSGLDPQDAGEAVRSFILTKVPELIHPLMQRMHEGIEAGLYSSRQWLIPTAEVSLTNLVREQITAAEQLPMRLTACTPCFRAEAGASGRDTRGMIRQHQFLKVELVSITAPEDSEAEHERMTGCAEAVLQKLELPYRVVELCTGDMGFSARRTFDIEVWLPSQGTYREISSCSNCGDFQARRMDARFKRAGAKGTEFVHTLNGSGLAVGRTLVAVMENHQEEDGRIAVPAALRPYMGGLTHIERPA